MKKIARLTVILLMLACVLSLVSCGKYNEVYEGLNGYWTLPEGEADLIIKFETSGKKNHKIIIMDDTLDVPVITAQYYIDDDSCFILTSSNEEQMQMIGGVKGTTAIYYKVNEEYDKMAIWYRGSTIQLIKVPDSIINGEGN